MINDQKDRIITFGNIHDRFYELSEVMVFNSHIMIIYITNK